jgi:hypothetical protein
LIRARGSAEDADLPPGAHHLFLIESVVHHRRENQEGGSESGFDFWVGNTSAACPQNVRSRERNTTPDDDTYGPHVSVDPPGSNLLREFAPG